MYLKMLKYNISYDFMQNNEYLQMCHKSDVDSFQGVAMEFCMVAIVCGTIFGQNVQKARRKNDK